MFITVNYCSIENYSQYEMQQEVLQKKVEFATTTEKPYLLLIVID